MGMYMDPELGPQTVHRNENGKFPCKRCGEPFSRTDSISRHIVTLACPKYRPLERALRKEKRLEERRMKRQMTRQTVDETERETGNETARQRVQQMEQHMPVSTQPFLETSSNCLETLLPKILNLKLR